MNVRCGECGRFAARIAYVWGPLPSSGPDHEACEKCHPELFTDAEALTRDEMTALGLRILAEATAAKRDARYERDEWRTEPARAEVDAAYEAAHAAQLLASRLILFSDREAEIAGPLLAEHDHEAGTQDDRVARWAELDTRLETVLPLVDADALTGAVDA